MMNVQLTLTPINGGDVGSVCLVAEKRLRFCSDGEGLSARISPDGRRVIVDQCCEAETDDDVQDSIRWAYFLAGQIVFYALTVSDIKVDITVQQ